MNIILTVYRECSARYPGRSRGNESLGLTLKDFYFFGQKN
jgi:hypothetical protein